MALTDHELRKPLSNELHARPFPILNAPCNVAYIALTTTDDDTEQLSKLIKHFGGSGETNGGHFYENLNGVALHWERHSEFVSYMICVEGNDDAWAKLPDDWLTGQTGNVLTKCKLQITEPKTKAGAEKTVITDIRPRFHTESLAISYVLDFNAAVASDFRMDSDGFVCFAIIPIGQTGSHRLGRITQRLLEIETYRAMSMLTLPIAKHVFSRLTQLDSALAELVKSIAERTGTHRENLDTLMAISSEIEFLNAEHAFRFGAGEAYAALVDQRIDVLREDRFMGQQTFSEFMMRRFSPTVRTCKAAQKRLQGISDRAARAVDLLGTRVSVRAAAQNNELMEKMDKRAALQLRLQETVEGLSVVAISYYAVNLISYLFYPIAKTFGLDKTLLTAITVVPVVLLVIVMVRRMKRGLSEP